MSPPPSAFYCVADERYFLGAVGLVNSLRLVGHTEPIHLLDCGLTEPQRELLVPHVEVVPAPDDSPPWLLKTVAPLASPARVMVLVDTDMIVTRSLSALVEQAAAGRAVAFRAPQDRFVPEWGELLDLGVARPGPYLSSALVLLGDPLGDRVLRLLEASRDRIDFELTFWRRNVADYPFMFADQDVLNSILATRIPEDHVVALDYRLSPTPPFEGLRVVDEPALRCAYDDGCEPYVVHHCITKPWLEPTHHGVYSRLLRRCLVGPGLQIEVPERDLPRRMRTGLLAYAERKRINARERLRWHLTEPLASRIGGLRGRPASAER